MGRRLKINRLNLGPGVTSGMVPVASGGTVAWRDPDDSAIEKVSTIAVDGESGMTGNVVLMARGGVELAQAPGQIVITGLPVVLARAGVSSYAPASADHSIVALSGGTASADAGTFFANAVFVNGDLTSGTLGLDVIAVDDGGVDPGTPVIVEIRSVSLAGGDPIAPGTLLASATVAWPGAGDADLTARIIDNVAFSASATCVAIFVRANVAFAASANIGLVFTLLRDS